ncbi:MAG: DUF6062 family protein [Chloroflexi bacterium]|nr:DUF6062 family protein [Chloroflexota bacterium]
MMPKKLSDSYSRTYFDLLEALRQPGCAVCRLVNDAVRQHIDIFIYENINNLARRDEIRASRGFCSVHTSLFMSGYGRLLSLATLEQDIMHNVLREIGDVIDKPDLFKKSNLFSRTNAFAQAIRDALLPRRSCPLCLYERDQETVVLGTLIQFIEDPDMRRALENSAGLCLPHFHMALGMPGKLDKIIEVEHTMLKQLKSDIDDYVHKRNPAYEDEQMGREADAPTRAAHILASRVAHADGRF